MKRNPGLAVGALLGLLGFAGQIATAEEPDCSDEDIVLVKNFVAKAKIGLIEAIHAAEYDSEGTAIHATLTFRAQTGNNGQNSADYQICCLADGKVVDVIVDSHSGAILATEDSGALPISLRLASSDEFGQRPSEHRPWNNKAAPTSFRILRASECIGMPVANESGERLGTVRDLAIDTGQGRVAYAVLSFSETLGAGDKWFAVPASALTLPANRVHFVLAMDASHLKTAPGFARDQWPAMGDWLWESKIHEFYDQQPYWMSAADGATPTNLHRIQKASDITGRSVQDEQGDELGSIEDLVIDPDQCRIAYAVLSLDGFTGSAEKLFAMPVSVLQLPCKEDFAVVTVDKDLLEQANGFDQNQWPNLADPAAASGIYELYGRRPYWTGTERDPRADGQGNSR